jgi:uncharacterized protein YjeT (DUF2065 family)
LALVVVIETLGDEEAPVAWTSLSNGLAVLAPLIAKTSIALP